MKAAVATGRKRGVECREVSKPEVEPGMLLLKTLYACICGSDLEYLDGSFESHMNQGPHAGSLAAQLWGSIVSMQPGGILGHEFVAEIAGIGAGVTGWEIGQRVVPQNHYLESGYGDKGSMTEYFLRPPNYVTKLPGNIPDEEAALVEPLAVSINAVNWAGLKAGDSLVIIGAGKIGLGALAYAKASGINPVIVIDIVQSRLEKALEMGAHIVLNAGKIDVVSEVLKLTEGGADAVIPCVREAKVLNQAIDMVKMYGVIPIAGFIAPIEVDPALWVVKELKLIGFRAGPPEHRDSISTAISLLKNRQIDIKPLITEIIPLEDVKRAFDSVYGGENIAVLLKP